MADAPHRHDAFGSDDGGVDYGPPTGCEEEEEEEEEDLFGDREADDDAMEDRTMEKGNYDVDVNLEEANDFYVGGGEAEDLFGDDEPDGPGDENGDATADISPEGNDNAIDDEVEVVEVVDLTAEDDPGRRAAAQTPPQPASKRRRVQSPPRPSIAKKMASPVKQSERAARPVSLEERRTLVLGKVPSHLRLWQVRDFFRKHWGATVQHYTCTPSKGNEAAGEAYVRFASVEDANRVYQEAQIKGLDNGATVEGGRTSLEALGVTLQGMHYTNYLLDSGNGEGDREGLGAAPAEGNGEPSLEELEEEAGLREATLASLHAKLRQLNAEIDQEYHKSERLRGDLQGLHERKAIMRKKTDDNLRLVKEVEGSIERCLERLRRALDERDEEGEGGGAVENGEEAERELGKEDADGDALARNAADPAMGTDAAQGGSAVADASTSNAADAEMAADRPVEMPPGDYTAVDIPLLDAKANSRGRNVAWPDPELARTIQAEADALPVVFPAWRTRPLSAPLLRGIDSVQLIVDIMNVSALERLLEREGRIKKGQWTGVCGWVREEDLWGTSLDVCAHVDWEPLFACVRRAQGDEEGGPAHTAGTESKATAIDPNVALCPYELGGTCADDRCPYQHLQRGDDARMSEDLDGHLRYNDFPAVRLPRAFAREDFVSKARAKEAGGSLLPSVASGSGRDGRWYHCPVCAGDKTYSEEELKSHLEECNNPSSLTVDGKQVTVRHVLRDPKVDPSEDDGTASTSDTGPDDSVGGDEASSADAPSESQIDAEEKCGVKDNLDYLSLPSVDDDGGDDNSNAQSPSDVLGALFDDFFWWQRLPCPIVTPSKMEGDHTTFDYLLSVFGFRRELNGGEDGSTDILWCMKSSSPDDESEQLENVLLFSRIVDLSRVLVHMGRDSMALSATSVVCELWGEDESLRALLEDAARSIQSLAHGRCSAALFQVQARLLLVSEALRAHYESLRGDGAVGEEMDLTDLLEQMKYLNHPMDCEGDGNEAHPLRKSGFVTVGETLLSHLPSSEGEGDGMEAFARQLRLMIEKFVVVPFTHLRTGKQQLDFLVQCICMGSFFGELYRHAANDRTLAPLLHILEPIWSSLQPLLRGSATSYYEQGHNRWLRPDIVALLVFGPAIFGSLANTIGTQGGPSISTEKVPPRLDARARADLTAYDNFISGVVKDLGRVSRRKRGFVEPLLAPIHAFSATLSIALGSMEKARLRLENVLNKDAGPGTKQPSMYALAEIIWSQLVSVRMFCPSFTGESSDPGVPSLPDKTVQGHREIASRIIGNGVQLWNVKLRGDTHMNLASPCFSAHRKEWEKAASKIFDDRPALDADGRGVAEQTSAEFGFRNSDRTNVVGLPGRPSVFPESLLILGKALTSLRLDKCGLTELPLGLGLHLTNLKSLDLSHNRLSELPSSISHMTRLEVLNLFHNGLQVFPSLSQCGNLRAVYVQHNQLHHIPADLALRCPNLQSFLFHGNPASEAIPPPQKRQKVDEDL